MPVANISNNASSNYNVDIQIDSSKKWMASIEKWLDRDQNKMPHEKKNENKSIEYFPRNAHSFLMTVILQYLTDLGTILKLKSTEL